MAMVIEPWTRHFLIMIPAYWLASLNTYA